MLATGFSKRSIHGNLLIGALLLGAMAPAAAQANEKAIEAAQATDAAHARELFKQALALQASGDFQAALLALQQVATFRLTPQVRYNIALCQEKLGKLADAFQNYRTCVAEAREIKAQDVATAASTAFARVEKLVPYLQVLLPETVPGATITLDGDELRPDALANPIPLNPGTHVIDAQAPGFEPFHSEVTLEPGASKGIEITWARETKPTETAATRPADEGPSPSSPSMSSSKQALRTGAWISGGVAVVSFAAAAVMYARRSSSIDDLNQACGDNHSACPASARDAYDNGKQSTTLGNIAMGLGIAGLATGVVLFAISASDGARSSTTDVASVPHVRLLLGASGGASLAGTF